MAALELMLALPVGVTLIKGALDALLGLRAKHRARTELAKQLEADPALKQRVMKLLDESNLAGAPNAISESLAALSKEDLRRIEQGLRQSSKSGEQRYITDLAAREAVWTPAIIFPTSRRATTGTP